MAEPCERKAAKCYWACALAPPAAAEPLVRANSYTHLLANSKNLRQQTGEILIPQILQRHNEMAPSAAQRRRRTGSCFSLTTMCYVHLRTAKTDISGTDLIF